MIQGFQGGARRLCIVVQSSAGKTASDCQRGGSSYLVAAYVGNSVLITDAGILGHNELDKGHAVASIATTGAT